MGANRAQRSRRLSGGETVAVRRSLLRWYDRNKRELAWRAHRDPYRIWVAEVMLQQTRIAVVEPAYRRFLRAFPTMRRLAMAEEEEVVAQWSGLGYYRRARALHRAARILSKEGRRFPRDFDAARKLPGVGPYTAAAVVSIAYGEPHAAVDGNVVRVLSRLRRLGSPDSRGAPYSSMAAELLDRDRPGDWNEAIMELGETLCVPVDPPCARCPLRMHCQAYRAGVVQRYPPVRKSRAPETVELTMLVLRDRRGRVLLERGEFRYLPRMWLPVVSPAAARAGSAAAPAGSADATAEVRHAITHRRFRIRVVVRVVAAASLRRMAAAGRTERRVFDHDEMKGIGRSSLLQKALRVGGGRAWADR